MPGHNLTAYYLYGECSTFPTTAQATANQSIVSTTGNGTLAPVAVTGLSADTLYCTSACVIDLNADPYTPVPLCGGVQNFSWTLPVSASEHAEREQMVIIPVMITVTQVTAAAAAAAARWL